MSARSLWRGIPTLLVAAAVVAVPTIGVWWSMGRGGVSPPTDIVYVIFDRYAGPEVLLEQYGFDNRRFLEGLRDRGFDVVPSARGNYPKTAHSLAASLNMRYLDHLAAASPPPGDWGPLYGEMQGARAPLFLQEQGYEYVHLGSWWAPTAADPAADQNVPYRTSSHLEPEEVLRRAVLGQLDDIALAAGRPGSQFVFAHVLLPHPPYIFDRRGEPLLPEDREGKSRKTLYLEQLRFTNLAITRLVDRLLAVPEGERPAIILQSDEGPHPRRYEADPMFDWLEATTPELREKLHLLLALYLPGAEIDVPPRMSPVNTFRLMLSEYFGQDLPLLPDRSYVFRDEAHLYEFFDVTDRVG